MEYFEERAGTILILGILVGMNKTGSKLRSINWGIIGCGDVTEVKSGPAFQLVKDSALVAVMRRDADKAADYALRHQVPKWYSDADELIADPHVNAIYVATPPSTHLAYVKAAVRAGKPVYVEKPMTIDAREAKAMARLGEGHPIVIAHYRRAQPLFLKIRDLVLGGKIGEPRYVTLELNRQRLTKEQLAVPKTAWRVDPAIAGGGLYHDLAPHQLDILFHLFGQAASVQGISLNQAGVYKTDDMVSANIRFRNDVLFNGTWCYSAAKAEEIDRCRIIGDKGSIEFSFFDQAPVVLTVKDRRREYIFKPLKHVQQPMIANVVEYFLSRGPNPCSAAEGLETMKWIDQVTKH